MESIPKNHLLELPADALQEIRKMHNLDKPGRMDEAIDILEEWIQKQDHFLKKDFKRDNLEKTLISTKGSVEKAKKQIDRLCTMRTLLPQFFSVANVKNELKDISEMAWQVPLPKVTNDFYRVLVIKLGAKPFSEKNFLEYYQYNLILCEYIKAHDYVNGFIVVYDYQQTNLMDLMTKLSPVQFQQYVSILVEGFGARLRGLYILTQSKTVDVLVRMIKQFLSQKIGDRIFVYKTLEELHMVVPKKILPVEYGGEERSIQKLTAEWTDELSTEENVDYIKTMRKACTNEKLRQADHFNQEYMGMPGSFRNMTVD